MFSNIGEKIKKLVVVCFVIWSVFSIITWLLILIASNSVIIRIFAFLGMVSFPFFAWIGSFFAYGFGELVDNSIKIRELLEHRIFQKNIEETKEEDILEHLIRENGSLEFEESTENKTEEDSASFYNPTEEEIET